MELTNKQKLYLKAKAHPLKPVVMLGQKGLTDNVINEIDSCLTTHELIKVKISGEEETKKAILAEITTKTSSNLIQIMGNNATLFRKNKEHSKYNLSNIE